MIAASVTSWRLMNKDGTVLTHTAFIKATSPRERGSVLRTSTQPVTHHC